MKVGDRYRDRGGTVVEIEIMVVLKTAIISKVTRGQGYGSIITDTKEDFKHHWEPFE